MTDRRLNYLREIGVDVWVRREPIAVTNRVDVQPRESVEEVAAPVAPFPPKASASVVLPVRPLPVQSRPDTSALDWSGLETAVKSCALCGLHATRTQTVFGVGDRQAEWMVIGEAPGADEDAKGEPFVGRAGQLLNSMLKACGMKREQVFIANILKCRPPQNRDPSPTEASCCTPYLHRQIELVDPKLILCVGRIAAQNLLNTDTPIGKLRGRVHRLGAAQRPVVVTYHPAYLLRSPGEKRRAWDDLVLAMKTLDEARST
jgi:uracil-DNA glycosylase family 4